MVLIIAKCRMRVNFDDTSNRRLDFNMAASDTPGVSFLNLSLLFYAFS